MHVSTTEIAENIFRITLFPDEGFIGFNHFLIRDQAPVLIHTGHRLTFPILFAEVSKLIDPKRLRYLCFSHMEPDECGNLNDWLRECPQAVIATGRIGAMSMKDFASGECHVLPDGGELDLGAMRLRLLITPHFPHQWDGCLFYEVTQGVLFCSDVAAQQGLCIPEMSEDISEPVIAFQERLGFIPYGLESLTALERLEALPLRTLAVMHGSVIQGKKPVLSVLGGLTRHIRDRLMETLDRAA